MALADDFTAANDPRVIAQVTAAIYANLQNIESEAPATNGHANRLVLAKTIALGQQPLQPLIFSAVCFGSLTISSTDTAVSNAVATLWNLWSGV
jgi:hypothetical protein